ncbi:hypothetical protein DPSP01_003369 [Paraphaeosphaeria sporulosa]
MFEWVEAKMRRQRGAASCPVRSRGSVGQSERSQIRPKPTVMKFWTFCLTTTNRSSPSHSSVPETKVVPNSKFSDRGIRRSARPFMAHQNHGRQCRALQVQWPYWLSNECFRLSNKPTAYVLLQESLSINGNQNVFMEFTPLGWI